MSRPCLPTQAGSTAAASQNPLAAALLRRLRCLPDQAVRTDIPQRPRRGRDLRLVQPRPGPVTNLFVRALFGAGAEVMVRRGHLVLKPLTRMPAMRRGMRLNPDEPDDPWVFRVEIPEYGKNMRVAFAQAPEDGGMRLLMEVLSFRKRPDVRNPRRWANAALAAGATTLAVSRLRRHLTRSVPSRGCRPSPWRLRSGRVRRRLRSTGAPATTASSSGR
jgi:hypothetical protein